MVLSTYDRETFGKTRYEDGVQQGEIKKQKEIAKNMKAAGESIEKIIQYTGLSKKEIKEI